MPRHWQPSAATKMITANVVVTIAMDGAGSQINVLSIMLLEAVTFNAPIGDQPFDIALSPDD